MRDEIDSGEQVNEQENGSKETYVKPRVRTVEAYETKALGTCFPNHQLSVPLPCVSTS